VGEMDAATATTADLECTHCHRPLTRHDGSGGVVRYYQCPGCYRYVTSTYAEVLRAGASFRPRQRSDEEKEREFTAVKARLERWLQMLDEQDPYRALGISPDASTREVRARFHQLAMEAHPDRGGSAAEMRKINAAYERVLASRAARALEAQPQRTLKSGEPVVSRASRALPPRSR
jgi:DnaJ-like protein